MPLIQHKPARATLSVDIGPALDAALPKYGRASWAWAALDAARYEPPRPEPPPPRREGGKRHRLTLALPLHQMARMAADAGITRSAYVRAALYASLEREARAKAARREQMTQNNQR